MHFSYRENKHEQEWEQNSLLLLFTLLFLCVFFVYKLFCQAKGMCEVKMEGELLKIITYVPLKSVMLLVLQILLLLLEVLGNVAK